MAGRQAIYCLPRRPTPVFLHDVAFGGVRGAVFRTSTCRPRFLRNQVQYSPNLAGKHSADCGMLPSIETRHSLRLTVSQGTTFTAITIRVAVRSKQYGEGTTQTETIGSPNMRNFGITFAISETVHVSADSMDKHELGEAIV